ncbi:dihydrofolate reductase [Terrilactibacillus laevilacticus]|uniref:dihydrofolate reductase n=1 Tax=Terrilactibacillus laevilacticus TaxID=1380157 RepID=UPI001146F4AE|nr:dihydrofolate reductase [Terrilactibacillus laevilacticus]
MISFLLAMDEKGLIGKNNDLPWHLPADLQYFKKITMGHSIIMGRKTYESIGRPLPGRRNIILTRNKDYSSEQAQVFYSEKTLLKYCDDPSEEYFIIGGAELFKSLFPYANKLYITRIHHIFEGDTYFGGFNPDEWHLISEVEGVVDAKNRYPHTFCIYERKSE